MGKLKVTGDTPWGKWLPLTDRMGKIKGYRRKPQGSGGYWQVDWGKLKATRDKPWGSGHQKTDARGSQTWGKAAIYFSVSEKASTING